MMVRLNKLDYLVLLEQALKTYKIQFVDILEENIKWLEEHKDCNFKGKNFKDWIEKIKSKLKEMK